MVEISTLITICNLRNEPDLLSHLSLELIDIYTLHASELVPTHIQNRSRSQFRSHKSLIELGSGIDLLHQFLWNDLSGIVLRIKRKQLRLESPIFVKLREHLHEVPLDARAAYRRVMTLRQQSVKCMSELVESSLHVVDAHILRQIAYIHDDRPYVVTCGVVILIADIVHPRSAAFAATREKVRSKNTDKRTVIVSKLPSGHAIRIIARNALYLLGIYAIKHLRSGKHSIKHILSLKVFAYCIFIQVILGTSYLLGIVPPVPLLYLGALREESRLDVSVHKELHLLQFLLGLDIGRIHYALQELIHGLRVRCHLVRKGEGRRRLVA